MPTDNRRSVYKLLNCDPCDPDFCIHVYTLGNLVKGDPTMADLRKASEHFYIFQVEDDPIAHHYVTDGLDHYIWPVVTITSGPELIAHWEGLRPDMLALITTLREKRAKATA